MKRKLTHIEETLLAKGFTLIGKTYTGKHSQNVEFYIYGREIKGYNVRVYLNNLRTKIDHWYFTNEKHHSIDYKELHILEETYNEIENFIFNTTNELDSEVEVQIAEVMVESENE